nr:immunoglobulin heavy chain junction region [Mus musculus]
CARGLGYYFDYW